MHVSELHRSADQRHRPEENDRDITTAILRREWSPSCRVLAEDCVARLGRDVGRCQAACTRRDRSRGAGSRPRTDPGACRAVPGTIDADYRGEVGVLLVNLGHEPFTVTRGMRIAQMVIASVTMVEILEVGTVDETLRGEGGFGSTGLERARP